MSAPGPTAVPSVSPFRPSGRRDRHGRGLRGPAFLAGPLAPEGVPARVFGADRFDALALTVMRGVVSHWSDRLGNVELAVEEIPLLPTHWSDETVPLASYVDPTPTTAPRLVLFRRPLEHRAETRADLEALLFTVLVEQFADVLGIDPEQVHPDYQSGDS